MTCLRLVVDSRVSANNVESAIRAVIEPLGPKLAKAVGLPPFNPNKSFVDGSTCRRLRLVNAVIADTMAGYILARAIRIRLIGHDASSINTRTIQAANCQVDIRLGPDGMLLQPDDTTPGSRVETIDLMVKGLFLVKAKDSQTGVDAVKEVYDVQLPRLVRLWRELHLKMFKVESKVIPQLAEGHSNLAKGKGGAVLSDAAAAAVKMGEGISDLIYVAARGQMSEEELSKMSEEEIKTKLRAIVLKCSGHVSCVQVEWGYKGLLGGLKSKLGPHMEQFTSEERATCDLGGIARAADKSMNWHIENMYVY